MQDPYATLELEHDATQNEIKRAYRKLAKTYHPDANPDDEAAAERFKEVTAAYEILTDPEKRAHYERRNRGQTWGGGFSGVDGARRPGQDVVFDSEFGRGDQPVDLFGDIAGNRRGRGSTSMVIPGEDMAAELTVTFIEAAVGALKPLTLMTEVTVEVPVAPGTDNGATITIPGYGFQGFGGAPPGDLNVIVTVEPHPELRRDSFNIRMDLVVTDKQLKDGERVMVPTIGGEMALEIPAGSKLGDTLCLSGMGLREPISGRRGDQLVALTPG